jgi:hypothetical protein
MLKDIVNIDIGLSLALWNLLSPSSTWWYCLHDGVVSCSIGEGLAVPVADVVVLSK